MNNKELFTTTDDYEGILEYFEDYTTGRGDVWNGWYWCNGTNRPDSGSWFYICDASFSFDKAVEKLKAKLNQQSTRSKETITEEEE